MTGRSAPARVADILLWIAAAAGVVCALSVIAAVFFNMTLIMFRTGSMEPTIPTGSVALVHEVPASEVRVGDIATIDRPGELPITHRVIAVEPVGDGVTREIRMQGDANQAEDPAPYVVDSARIVLGSVPGLAYVVVAMSNPIVLVGVTFGAAVLVTWAFWPRAGARGAAARPENEELDPAYGDGADDGDAYIPDRQPARRRLTVTLVLVGMLPLPFAALAAPAPAQAAPTESVVQSRYFELTSVGDPTVMTNLVPGVPVQWQVGVVTDAPSPGTVRVGIAGDGALVDIDGLQLAVAACAERFVDGDCASGAREWLPPTGVAEATTPQAGLPMRELATLAPIAERWLMVTAVLDSDTDPGDTADIRIQVIGSGDDVSTGPPEPGDGGVGAGGEVPDDGSAFGPGGDGGLAATGVGGLGGIALLSLGAVGLGLVTAATASRVQKRRGARV